MSTTLIKLANEINNARKIAIFTHKSPDLDAIGSSLSLYYACKDLGKKVNIYLKDDITEHDIDLIIENPIKKEFIDKKYDIMISTDTSSPNLLGDFKDIFLNAKKKIVIDHHASDLLQGDFTYRQSKYSSCSEICYNIIKTLKVNFSPKIASLIFIGLTGDTNSFINTNTTANSFYVAYKCIKAGADITRINDLEYKSKTKKIIDLEKYLLNNYKIENGISYCLITHKKLNELGAIKEDCDFYSSKLLTIKEAKISFSLIEQYPDYYSLSMRGKLGYNVKEIATKFGGGGHISASGAKIVTNNAIKLKNDIIKECKIQCEKNEN